MCCEKILGGVAPLAPVATPLTFRTVKFLSESYSTGCKVLERMDNFLFHFQKR